MPEPAAHRATTFRATAWLTLPLAGASARRAGFAGHHDNGSILTEEPWLAEYYSNNVIGGASSLPVAENMDSFAEAMPAAGRRWLARPRYAARGRTLPASGPAGGASSILRWWPGSAKPQT